MITEERWDVIPGAEPADEFAARVRDALVRLAGRHPDATIAVFTHGGVIGQALAEAAKSRPFAFTGADNGSISYLVITPDRWVVRASDQGTLADALGAAGRPAGRVRVEVGPVRF